MGQIIISIAAGLAKRALHIGTLDNMHIARYQTARKSERNNALGTALDYENMQNDDVNFRNDEILRVPSEGYAGRDLFSVPRNNIIIEDVEKSFKIEFINAKCKIIKENHIVEQAVVNHDGTVKEFINAKDYDIIISGDIISDFRYNFPINEMETLIGLLSQKTNLNVEGVLFSIFGIEQMVFKTGTFDQTSAKYVNAMPFSLQFVSDINYDFLVTDNI